MISIPARWSAAVWCALVLLLMLGASSCDQDHPVRPNIYPPTKKKTRPVPCDTTVTVNPAGPQPDPVYLCEYDTLTWVKGAGTNSFVIHFKDKSPFADNAKDFDDKNASDKAKGQYGPLEIDKYSITINSTTTLDPQVVTGGNP